MNLDYHDTNTECPVCSVFLRDPVNLVCGHSFCKKCIEKLMFEKKTDCPMCRRRLKIKPNNKRLSKKRP